MPGRGAEKEAGYLRIMQAQLPKLKGWLLGKKTSPENVSGYL